MDPPAHADRERRILSLWGRAVGRSRRDRDDTLLADAGRPRALGERNRALLAVRIALFGRDWPLRSDCPACAGACEFTIDGLALAESLNVAGPTGAGSIVEWHGREVALRAPTADDLEGIAGEGDVASAARALLARCMPADVDVAELAEDEIDLLGDRIESLDPAAAISFALECPDCRHHWPAPVDVAGALWGEVQRAAERSLTEVDALARAYGWSEEEVVSLSPVRRAAYLQLVAAS